MTRKNVAQAANPALLLMNLSGCFVERPVDHPRDHRYDDRRDDAYRHCGPHGEDCDRDDRRH